MDDAGSYTLDWEASALRSGSNVEVYELNIWAGQNRFNQPTTSIFDGSVSNDLDGSTSGLQSAGFDVGCARNPGEGKISMTIFHPGSNGTPNLDTVGTYVATISLIVRPE